MSTPLDTSVNVGYVEAEDVYIVFSEYYGNGTIYGRREVNLPSGEAVRGAGKTYVDLMALGALVADYNAGAVGGDLVRVPMDAPVDAPAEAPVDAPVNAHAEAPVDAPAEVPADAPAEPPAPTPVGPLSVRLEVCGMVVTYENVKQVRVTDSNGNIVYTGF